MNTNLEKLEWNQVLNLLANNCVTDIGKQIAFSLFPSSSKEFVQNLLKETKEAVNLVYRNSFPVFHEIQDINFELKSLESSMTLSCKSLLNLNLIFQSAYELKEYFNKDFLDISDFPILSNLFSGLYTNKSIIDKITRRKCYMK